MTINKFKDCSVIDLILFTRLSLIAVFVSCLSDDLDVPFLNIYVVYGDLCFVCCVTVRVACFSYWASTDRKETNS